MTPSKAAMDAAEQWLEQQNIRLNVISGHWLPDLAAAFDAFAAAQSAELIEALYVVDRMFSEPGKWNKSSVRDCVRAAIAKATGEQP